MEVQSEVILILVGSTFIILIFIGLSVFALITNQKRKFKHQQQLIELKNTYNQELLKVQIETQTHTMENISRELHDNVGALLSIVLAQLKSPSGDFQDLIKKNDELRPLLEEAMTILRDVSVSMNPSPLEESGLRNAIIRELENVKKTKLFKVDLINKGEEFWVNPVKCLVIFRIFQETLNNILKHSNANYIKVVVECEEPKITLFLEDNGQGFDISDRSNNGAGLKNIHTRSKLIGAELKIESTKFKGTLLKLTYIEEQVHESAE